MISVNKAGNSHFTKYFIKMSHVHMVWEAYLSSYCLTNPNTIEKKIWRLRKEWFHLRNLIVAITAPILQDFLAPAEFLLRIISKICINIYNSSPCPQGEKDEIEKKMYCLKRLIKIIYSQNWRTIDSQE